MIKMADGIIVNEVLCFIYSRYGSVQNDNISTAISSYYADEELVQAKVAIHDICV